MVLERGTTMKKTWLRILCVAMLSVLLCMMLVACKDFDNNKNPEVSSSEMTTEESTPEVSSTETTTEKTDPPKPVEKIGNEGENTDTDWGNDVIA